MNSRIEATKFEPETTFEKNIDDIKADHVKSITSLNMNLLAITSNKTYLSSEHLNVNLMPWIVLQLPIKPPQFTKHLSYMHLKGNIQLQTLKCCAALIKDFIYTFLSFFFQCLSTNSTIFPTDKKLKNTVPFFKTTIICP